MKKMYLFRLILLVLILSGCTSEQPEVTTVNPEALTAEEIGTSSYSCITEESEAVEEATEDGTVMLKTFSHRIYNPNSEYIVTLTSTLIYPAGENPTAITDVSASLSDAQSDGLTVSEHLAGDTATVVLYLNDISVCHFQYRIHTDGTVEFL